MPESVPVCSQYYTQVTHPNLIDHEEIEDAVASFNRRYFLRLPYKDFVDCYQYFDKTKCYLFFPRCNATSNSFIVPCRESYEELREECLGGIKSFNVKENILTTLQLKYDYVNSPKCY